MNDILIKNGTIVILGESKLKATVIGVCMRGIDSPTIEYHIQWVDSTGIHSEWVYSYMISEFKDNSRPAGMVNYETGLSKWND